jgi:hypothetical protein
MDEVPSGESTPQKEKALQPRSQLLHHLSTQTRSDRESTFPPRLPLSYAVSCEQQGLHINKHHGIFVGNTPNILFNIIFVFYIHYILRGLKRVLKRGIKRKTEVTSANENVVLPRLA